MSLNKAEEIIQEINDQIEPLKLAVLLNYFPQKIQDAGAQIKLFCPLHKEQAFRSLTLDPKTHTYRCSMKRCAGFEGGTFVRLWEQHSNQQTLEAALDLAEKLKLGVDVAALRMLGGEMVAKAREALNSGQLDVARASIDQAIGFDPRDVEAGKLSAQIYLRTGDKEKANQEFLRIVDLYLDARDFDSARQLLNPLIATNPKNIEFAKRRVILSRGENNLAALVETLFVLAVLYAQNGMRDSEIQTLDELIGLSGSDARVLERVADIHQRGERTNKVMEVLERLAPIYEAGGDLAKLAAILERRISYAPDDLEVQEQMAGILLRLGNIERAGQRLLKLAETYKNHGDLLKAQSMLQKLVEVDPNNKFAMEEMAELAAASGQRREAIEAFRRLATMARESGRMEDAARCLARARAIDPNDYGLRLDLAEAQLAQGNTDEAIAELFGLADVYLTEADPAEGFRILDRIREIVPEDVTRHMDISRCLEAAGFDEQAVEGYESLIQRLMGKGSYEEALNVCTEARRLSPLSDTLSEARLQCNLALGRMDEAVQVCRETAQERIRSSDYRQGETALRRGIELNPNNTIIQTDLARMLEQVERTDEAVKLWLEIAALHRGNSSLDESVYAIREAIRLAPDDMNAQRLLAETLEAKGQNSEALEIWRYAIQTLLERDAESAEALDILDHALQLSPDELPMISQTAQLKYKVQGADAARSQFENWITKSPNSADPDALLQALQTSVESYPEEMGWRSQLADLLIERGESEDAFPHMEQLVTSYRHMSNFGDDYLRILDQLVQIHPQRLDLRLEWAEGLARQGKIDKAVGIFSDIAMQYLSRGDQENGLEVLQRSLTYQPENRELLMRIGELQERLGRFDNAVGTYNTLVDLSRRIDTWRSNVAVIEKLLLLSPERPDLRLELARTYESHGEMENAVDQYYRVAQVKVKEDPSGGETLNILEKLVTLAPVEMTAAREMLIECYLARFDIEKAKTELELLGDYHLRTGETARAEETFKRIQEIDPLDIGSGERLGKLYEARGETDRAYQSYTQVLALYEQRQDNERIISVLRKLKSLSPRDMDLRLRLARTLTASGNRDAEATEEWYDVISIAVTQDKLPVARSAMQEARHHFATRWDYRFKIIQLFSGVQDSSQTIKAWKSFSEQALAANQDQIVREAASEGLELAPADTQLLELRIQASRRLEDLDGAEADLRTLANKSTEGGKHAQAEKYLIRALEIKPQSAELLGILAQTQIDQNHIDDAVGTLQRLTERHQEAGDLEEAVDRARQIISLQPDSVEAKDSLASLLMASEEIAAAMDIWRDVGNLLASRGDLQGAISRFNSILGMINRDIAALRRVADLTREAEGCEAASSHYDRLLDVMMIENEAPEAIDAEFKRVIELEPEQLNLAEKYASYLYATNNIEGAIDQLLRINRFYQEERGDFGEALRVIRQLREWDPANLAVLKEEASILEKMGDREQAVEVLRHVASAYRMEGDDTQACDAVAHCADILSENVEVQIEAAEAYERLGEDARATEFYLRAIGLHRENGDLDASIPLLKRTIAINPDRIELGEELGRLYEQTNQSEAAVAQWLELGGLNEVGGDVERAVGIYCHVKTISPREMEARRRLARITADQGNTEASLRELREMLPISEDVSDPDETVSILRRILEMEPSDSVTMIQLADQFRRSGDDDELYEVLLQLEQLYIDQDRLTEAVDVLQELRALHPDDLELARKEFNIEVKLGKMAEAATIGIMLVETYLEKGDKTRATEMILEVDAMEPGNIDRRIALAHLAHSNGYPEIALDEFRRGSNELFESRSYAESLKLAIAGLDFYPEDVKLRRTSISNRRQIGEDAAAVEELLSLSNLYEMQGNDEEAVSVLNEILADNPEDVETHENIIRLAIRQDNMERTEEHLLQLAEIHYGNSNLDDSIQALERLLEMLPQRNELRSRLAELHHEAGNGEEAREAWFRAAHELREADDITQAIEIYQRVRDLYPDDVHALAHLTTCYRGLGNDEQYLASATNLGAIYSQTEQFEEATRTFEALTERFPRNVEIWEMLASSYTLAGAIDDAIKSYRTLNEIHQSSKRFDLARNSLEQALKLRPGDIEILEQLGEICLRLNQRTEGLGYLDAAARQLKDEARFDESRQIIERILKIDPTNLETRRTLGSVCEAMDDNVGAVKNYSLAARGWSERRNNAQAVEVFEHLLTINPALSEEREAYAHVLEREGRSADACEQYLTLIRSLDAQADPRQVIRYCRQILKDSPDNVDAHIHLYRVYERTRKPRLALEEAQWLADYYISLGEMDHAEEYIRRGLEQSPGEIELRKRYVEILIETHRTGEAAQNLSELASSARATGDLRTAKWALMRACDIMPDNLAYRQELAQLLELGGELAEARRVRLEIMRIFLENGDMEEARAMGERIMQGAPDNEEMRENIAQIFEVAGLPEVAAFHYTHMAQTALAREDYPKVIQITERILKLKPRHIQARDCLVKALTATGDTVRASHHSRELYNLHYEAGDLEASHQALKFVIQCKPSDPEPRHLLIDLYRRMRRAEPMVEQMRRLAEIYANEGNIDNAVQVLRSLMSERPDDTRARARYIDLYSQMGEESDLYKDYLALALIFRKKGAVVEASQVYEKLLRMHPNVSECREQFVDFLFEQGQVSRGVEESRSLIDLYLQKDMKIEAGRALERALSKSPGDTQMRHQLATLQLRTNRRGMALETLRGLLKQYEQAGMADQQVDVIEQILEIDNLNVELRERLAELHLQMGQSDRAREQRVALAQQYLNRQLYDLAEREYRRILEVNPIDVEIWQKVIETHLQIGSEIEVIPDMMALANVFGEMGRLRDAVALYSKLRELDPENILILSRYIESYMQIGMEEDLIDDYLKLATLLSQAGNVEGALKIYQHLQELAPENTRVRLGLQASDPMEPMIDPTRASRVIPILSPEQKLSEFIRAEEPAAANHEPVEPQLEKAIRNYENILKLNPENPAVRAKLAELIAKTGRMKEADDQWAQAANDFFNRGDYDKCIDILEEMVGRHPEDARLRERLSRAILQRESLNAIGSILDGPK